MTGKELMEFTALVSHDLYGLMPVMDESDLPILIRANLTGWVPIHMKEGEDWSNIPLHRLITIPSEYYPDDYDGHTGIKPCLTVGGVEMDPRTIVAMNSINTEAADRLREDIKYKLDPLFWDKNNKMWDMANSFPLAVFYDKDGHIYNPKEVATVRELLSPPLVRTVVNPIINLKRFLSAYGRKWEAEAHRRTRPDIPLPDFRKKDQINRASTLVYPVTWKTTTYKVKLFDPASLACDPQKAKEGSLYPRVQCLAHRELMEQRTEGLNIKFDGKFEIPKFTEYEWPPWKSDIRKRGQFLRTIRPGDDRTRAICHLPSGSTGLDVRMAYGNSIPVSFNSLWVPANMAVMMQGQHADNPHDLSGAEFLPPTDRFVVGGHLTTIPHTKVYPGSNLSLKRCSMCQVIITVITMCSHSLTKINAVGVWVCGQGRLLPHHLYRLPWRHRPDHPGQLCLHLLLARAEVCVHILAAQPRRDQVASGGPRGGKSLVAGSSLPVPFPRALEASCSGDLRGQVHRGREKVAGGEERPREGRGRWVRLRPRGPV